ncbi:MAG TPA: L,D-transpeptidase family protein [Sphingomicrobium sp.]|nr:L,D-transpeptidase family protein [Sphingomicrobium sp.]
MKTLLATLGFSLGGAAAAALFGHPHPAAHATAGPTPVQAAAPLERIAISPADLRQAYASGLIDRPIKTILDVRTPMAYGDYRWDDKGVPPGTTWVRVDLKTQLISVFRSGHEIGTAVILYGADGVPTPIGKFAVLAKLKDHRSATYDNAPMPYTLRLTADGVSIHGSNVRWGFATHGCIGVPTAFAAKLFDAVKIGDDVSIIRGEGSPKPV